MLALLFALMATPAVAFSSAFQTLQAARVVSPGDGQSGPLMQGLEGQRALVVLLPQLGEFDSFEFCELLAAVGPELEAAGVQLRCVGIGSAAAGRRFAEVSGLPVDQLRVDPAAAVHRALNLHAGPGWAVPEAAPASWLAALLSTLPGGAPDDPSQLRPVATAWLNYLAMCAGVAAPGTLPEILRGYFGDRSAPERLLPDAVVKVGSFVEIGPGVGPVRLGPFKYQNAWADQAGYQRPVELATVRLRHMVEVLSHFDAYVSDPSLISQRGATYLFEADGSDAFAYEHPGVLTYSPTMPRPLTFLAPVLGAKALNPLGLGDQAVARFKKAT